MIDPDKLPDDAVQAAERRAAEPGRAFYNETIAAFLDALLADDEMMKRALTAFVAASSNDEAIRAALTAAVQEDR
jgi:hypothetical protein